MECPDCSCTWVMRHVSQCLPVLGIGMGNPGVFLSNLYPNPTKTHTLTLGFVIPMTIPSLHASEEAKKEALAH
jgi:hypothetical protein